MVNKLFIKRLLIGVVAGILVLVFFLYILFITASKESTLFLAKIFPSLVTQTSYPAVLVNAVSFGPPKWEYQLWFPPERLPKTIKAGSTLTIRGIGIESASVTGDASLPEFGAWRVREIAPNHQVMFESIVEAKLTNESFSGFSVTAPKAINGEVNWYSIGFSHLSSQGGKSGTASGPVGGK